jgi:hypothetical protein
MNKTECKCPSLSELGRTAANLIKHEPAPAGLFGPYSHKATASIRDPSVRKTLSPCPCV